MMVYVSSQNFVDVDQYLSFLSNKNRHTLEFTLLDVSFILTCNVPE